jgi:hypothetical protein
MTTRVTVSPPEIVKFAKVEFSDGNIFYVPGGMSTEFVVQADQTITILEDPEHVNE